jgi:hypothetical protein
MLLYELLTGKPPFVGESEEEVMQLVALLEALPPSRVAPQVPRDLETICLKCLAKHPAARYGSAAALADDLERFLAGQDVAARKLSMVEHMTRWIGRNRVASVLAVAVVLLLIAVILLFVLYRRAATERVLSADPEQMAERLETVRTQVTRLVGEHRDNGELLYGLAGVLASSASAADTPQAMEGYAAMALEVLKQAQLAGFFRQSTRIERFKKDPVFDGLRGRADYQQWLKEAENR